MKGIFSNLYLTARFFYLWGAAILLFITSFPYPTLYPVAVIAIPLLLFLTVLDCVLLFSNSASLAAVRKVSAVLSIGQDVPVRYTIYNKGNLSLKAQLLDELPEQLQKRNFSIPFNSDAGGSQTFEYTFRPVERGEYSFGKLYCFVSDFIGLVQRRMLLAKEETVAVYPSILDMKRFELKGFNRSTNESGIKKLRRIGHSYEFEQIKNYVQGDDYRSINWKATGRRADLMVNQYEDEKAQSVYSVIDKSRVMKMPFAGMSLLDYAINASLVISNIALGKQDKAGLITFSDKVNTTIPADRGKLQLKRILDSLYKEKERFVEANYELLYLSMRNTIKGRSLVLFFTNFESSYALQRVLPMLRRINQKHLLVVVFFENTEVNAIASNEVNTLEDIYTQGIAQKYIYEKQQLVQELKQYGIYSLLTKPQDLTVNTVNKYLELKSRGLI